MAILGPKNYRFGLRDPDLVYGDDILKNIYKQFKWVLGFLPWSQCSGQLTLVAKICPNIKNKI
jgi:hypothetical protein